MVLFAVVRILLDKIEHGIDGMLLHRLAPTWYVPSHGQPDIRSGTQLFKSRASGALLGETPTETRYDRAIYIEVPLWPEG